MMVDQDAYVIQFVGLLQATERDAMRGRVEGGWGGLG